MNRNVSDKNLAHREIAVVQILLIKSTDSPIFVLKYARFIIGFRQHMGVL